MPDPQTYNEKELIFRIAEGDEDAFRQVFDHYRSNIYTTILRLTGDAWLAEELMQDTFLKAWLKRSELPALDNFGGWLYTIGERLTLNALRNAERMANQTQDWELQLREISVTEGSRTLEEKEFEELLHSAITRLPERQQQTYRLVRQLGLRREEAARQLGVSPETVKSNLEQAMRSIRAFCLARMDITSGLVIFYLICRS